MPRNNDYLILHNQKLVDELRKAFDKAKYRIWIAVPFIGSWKYVERILGNNWMTKKNIDFRLITDTRNENFIFSDSLDIFRKCGEIKTLAGLHAKVYIIDDFILVTSANLTDAAFSKRFEIGTLFINQKHVLQVFNEWWNEAVDIKPDWQPTINKGQKNKEPDEKDSERLKTRWKLPKLSYKHKYYTEYAMIVKLYSDFAKLYEQNVGRIIPKLTLYLEVDSFFNFLFHQHPEKPSNQYYKLPFRKLDKNHQVNELKKYFKQYENWLISNKSFEVYRIDRMKTINKKLSKSNIDKLIYKDIEKIVDCLHCMNSLPLNKSRFLNPKNNSLDIIKTQWKNLLHNNSVGIPERMSQCNKSLNYFGKSSIRELIGWYYPNDFPIINTNSNSGMKFFGYDIKTY